MKYRMPVYYSDFSCIGAACEDTCCGGWQIEIDKKSYENYCLVPGEFGERLRAEMDEDSRTFHLNGRRCAFLDDEGLCDIYRELGKEYLCRTCRTYPRHMEDYGEVREIMLSLTCPEAARLILGDASDGAWKAKEKAVKRSEKERKMDPDPGLLECIQKMRQTIVRMVKDRGNDLYDRFAMVLSYAHDIQRHFDLIYDVKGTTKDIADDAWRSQCLEGITGRYLRPQASARFKIKLEPLREKAGERYIRLFSWMRVLETLEPVLEHWEKKQGIVCTSLYHSRLPEEYSRMERKFAGQAAVYEKEWENLFLYFIHTYLPGACYDEDVYSKVKLAVFSLMMIREWCLFRYGKTGKIDREMIVAAAYRYAREVENSDFNLELLEGYFQDDIQFGLKYMLTVLAGTYG